MIFNINSTRGQTRFLTCVARVTCLVNINESVVTVVGSETECYVIFDPIKSHAQ